MIKVNNMMKPGSVNRTIVIHLYQSSGFLGIASSDWCCGRGRGSTLILAINETFYYIITFSFNLLMRGRQVWNASSIVVGSFGISTPADTLQSIDLFNQVRMRLRLQSITPHLLAKCHQRTELVPNQGLHYQRRVAGIDRSTIGSNQHCYGHQ